MDALRNEAALVRSSRDDEGGAPVVGAPPSSWCEGVVLRAGARAGVAGDLDDLIDRRHLRLGLAAEAEGTLGALALDVDHDDRAFSFRGESKSEVPAIDEIVEVAGDPGASTGA
jgi:hypothetical protein